MKTGDLVCLRGTAAIGVVLEFVEEENNETEMVWGWVFVLWPSHGKSMEKIRDLEVIIETR